MTERRRGALRRDRTGLSIGSSRLDWDGDGLLIAFDEIAAPWPSRVRGEIRLRPRGLNRQGFQLDARGGHTWRPIAPRADVEVAIHDPACAWRGEGYFDTNAGDEPLEDAFSGWDWSRAHRPTDTRVFYDVRRRGGGAARLAVDFAPDGAPTIIEPLPRVQLPMTAWRLARWTSGDPNAPPVVRETLEDTPFYARSALTGRSRSSGAAAEVMHESLSLDRLRSPIVRAMLPFRMPRTLR